MLDNTHLSPPDGQISGFTIPAEKTSEAYCLWCGETEVLEIADIWSGDEFMLETCCQQVVAEMGDDPTRATELLRQFGAEVLTGHRLRRLYDDAAVRPCSISALTCVP